MGLGAGALLSPEEEARLGEAFMRRLRSQVRLLEDPLVESYVQALGYRLVAAADTELSHFAFFVVQDPRINAFAGPWGYIGVNSGLILAARSEGELAAVLAHEIAHVTQRHLLRTLEQSRRLGLPAAAALLAAILLGTRSPAAGQAAAVTAAAAGRQLMLNFSRAEEAEADRVGLALLARAGYDPRAMPAFFERLWRHGRLQEGELPPLLRTHPVTTARIADTRARAERYPRPAPRPRAEEAFRLLQARVAVLTAEDPLAAARALEAGSLAGRYARALALLRTGRAREARPLVERLLAQRPEEVAFLLLRGRLLLEEGRTEKALGAYRRALRLYPHHYSLTVAYARALLAAGQAGRARELLQDYLRYREPTPLLYRLLARAEAGSGRPAEAQLSLAELAYLEGRTAEAVAHLERALRMTPRDDLRRLARIRTRLKALRRELAREASR
ncbi:MAG: M48 family peptidase [Gammaproteobacteria bacterium]|nr:MAG: M48 family peptidase [Gammaproteobacteria bacterium]